MSVPAISKPEWIKLKVTASCPSASPITLEERIRTDSSAEHLDYVLEELSTSLIAVMLKRRLVKEYTTVQSDGDEEMSDVEEEESTSNVAFSTSSALQPHTQVRAMSS